MAKTEFIWTDELVREMIYQKFPINEGYYGQVQKALEEFKKSKEIKEKERIEVKEFYFECHAVHGYEYVVATNRPINPQKHSAIKSAIESALNDEQPKEEKKLELGGGSGGRGIPKSEQKHNRGENAERLDEKAVKCDATTSLTHEYVTLEECELREREAFVHGRLFYSVMMGGKPHYDHKYPTFEDYKESIKKQ